MRVLLFLGSECCVVMQISMRIQIWVLVSMMDFMPGKGEHEICIFCRDPDLGPNCLQRLSTDDKSCWEYVHANCLQRLLAQTAPTEAV